MLIYIQSCLYLIQHFTKYSVYLTAALACNSSTLIQKYLYSTVLIFYSQRNTNVQNHIKHYCNMYAQPIHMHAQHQDSLVFSLIPTKMGYPYNSSRHTPTAFRMRCRNHMRSMRAMTKKNLL